MKRTIKHITKKELKIPVEFKIRVNFIAFTSAKGSLDKKPVKLYSLRNVKTNDDIKHFEKPLTEKIPKIYIIHKDKKILYVGTTSQGIASRLYGGLKSTGKAGYYGYSWKNLRVWLFLSIWYFDVKKNSNLKREIETIEAEIVHLCRIIDDKWPSHQTEIHFYPSSFNHRECAKIIFQHIRNIS